MVLQENLGPRSVLAACIRLAFCLIFACTAGGCVFTTKNAHNEIASNSVIHLKEGRMGPEEIERVNRAFADRYVMRISTACDLITEGNPDDAQCRRMRDLRGGAAMNAYDIVSDPDPYLQTLNLTVIITLTHMSWVEEDNAHKVFGDRGGALQDAMKSAYMEVNEIAAKIFSPEELKTLDHLIRQWREKNPELRHLSHARFTDFLASSEWQGEARTEAAGLFAQIDQARQSVDEVRELAERALYLGKRMPLMIAWQSEMTLDSFTANASVSRALGDFHTIATAADRLPTTIDQQRKALVEDVERQRKALVDDADRERKALFADFDQRQPAIDGTLKNMGTTLNQADSLAQNARTLLVEMQKASTSLQELFKQWDVSFGRLIPGGQPAPATTVAASVPASAPATPPSPATRQVAAPQQVTTAPAATPPSENQGPRPFDIRDYTVALKQASDTARDLNTALVSTDKLLASPSWQERVTEINSAADGRVRLASERSQELVSSIFQKVYIALGGLFLVLIFSRLVSTWLLKVLRLQRDTAR